MSESESSGEFGAGAMRGEDSEGDSDMEDLNMAEFDGSTSSEDEEDEGRPIFEAMERKTLKLQQKKRQMKEDAELETKESIKRAAADAKDSKAHGFEFPTAENLVQEKELGVDLSYIKSRFEETLRILSNFSDARDGIHTRQEYLDLLIHDLAFYYGYNTFLVGKFMQLFSPSECAEFIQANEAARPLTIRVNTLKARRGDLTKALASRGVNLEPIPWSKVAVQVFESSVPIGATPEYLAGHYMLQSASSMTSVVALDPQPDERILDMCAAPGGKTTYIAQCMKNTGTLVANDVHPDRLKSLSANLHRLGVRNAIVTNYDGKEFPTVMAGFDRVLLDAPCTGTGVIARDASVKVSKSAEDIIKLGQTQRRLILAAIDSIDPNSPTGGILVYATCSITVEENEAIVDYALKKRYVKVVDSGMEFGKPGIVAWKHHRFNDQVKLARRYYPHVYNMDGFFICKLKKLQNGVKVQQDKKRKRGDDGDESEDDEFGSDEEMYEVVQSRRERKNRKNKRIEDESEEEPEFEEISDDEESEESEEVPIAIPINAKAQSTASKKSPNGVPPPKKKAKVSEVAAVAKTSNGKDAVSPKPSKKAVESPKSAKTEQKATPEKTKTITKDKTPVKAEEKKTPLKSLEASPKPSKTSTPAATATPKASAPSPKTSASPKTDKTSPKPVKVSTPKPSGSKPSTPLAKSSPSMKKSKQ